MTNDQREIHRKKRVLEYAERIGHNNKDCRYFGCGRRSMSGRILTLTTAAIESCQPAPPGRGFHSIWRRPPTAAAPWDSL